MHSEESKGRKEPQRREGKRKMQAAWHNQWREEIAQINSFGIRRYVGGSKMGHWFFKINWI